LRLDPASATRGAAVILIFSFGYRPGVDPIQSATTVKPQNEPGEHREIAHTWLLDGLERLEQLTHPRPIPLLRARATAKLDG